ncbi:MAG: hypothetical protein AAF458_05435 [Pseudomonadota bacterium]
MRVSHETVAREVDERFGQFLREQVSPHADARDLFRYPAHHAWVLAALDGTGQPPPARSNDKSGDAGQ